MIDDKKDSTHHDTFYVGVTVLIVRNEQLLLGQRKNVFGHGTWALPGGHLENGESMKAAGKRELQEETGLIASDLEFVGLANTPEGTAHHIQVGFLAKNVVGEPEVKEPEQCFAWQWFDLNHLPDPLFPNHAGLIQVYKEKSYFLDS